MIRYLHLFIFCAAEITNRNHKCNNIVQKQSHGQHHVNFEEWLRHGACFKRLRKFTLTVRSSQLVKLPCESCNTDMSALCMFPSAHAD